MRSRRNSYAFKEDPDKEVYEPAPIIPLRPRTTTDELMAQVHSAVDGKYHRRIPTLSHTACGEPTHSEWHTRREELCEPICRNGCFTPFELRIVDERTEKEQDNG